MDGTKAPGNLFTIQNFPQITPILHIKVSNLIVHQAFTQMIFFSSAKWGQIRTASLKRAISKLKYKVALYLLVVSIATVDKVGQQFRKIQPQYWQQQQEQNDYQPLQLKRANSCAYKCWEKSYWQYQSADASKKNKKFSSLIVLLKVFRKIKKQLHLEDFFFQSFFPNVNGSFFQF